MQKAERISHPPLHQPSHPSPQMPRPALLFRWFVGLLGIVCLAIFAPWLPAGHTTELLALLIVSVAAELWLTLELPRRRFLSLSGVFTFVSFLSFGPAGAALVNTGSVLLAQLIR